MSPVERTEWGAELSKFLQADQAHTLASLVDVNDLVWDVDANKSYGYDFTVYFKSTAATIGLGLAVSCPASYVWIAYVADIPISAIDSAGSQLLHGSGIASDDVIQGTAVGAANTVYVARLVGALANGVNAGQLKLRFQLETTPATITLLKGTGGSVWPAELL